MPEYDPDLLKELFQVPPKERLACFMAEAFRWIESSRGYSQLIRVCFICLENRQAETEPVEVVAAFAPDRLCLRQAQATATF